MSDLADQAIKNSQGNSDDAKNGEEILNDAVKDMRKPDKK